jgi:hypothetical protein
MTQLKGEIKTACYLPEHIVFLVYGKDYKIRKFIDVFDGRG